MARKIQSQSPRSGPKGFAALLGNAVFWLIVAIVLPVKAIVGSFPELAAFAPWAPLVLYGLALLSFVRAVLSLRSLAGGSRRSVLGQQKQAGQAQSPAKQARSASGLPVTRTPTVQRMR